MIRMLLLLWALTLVQGMVAGQAAAGVALPSERSLPRIPAAPASPAPGERTRPPRALRPTGTLAVTLRVIALDFTWTGGHRTFPDSLAAGVYLADWVDQQQAQAFWEASVDSLYRGQQDQLVAVLHRGPAYSWAGLTPPADAAAQDWLRKAGLVRFLLLT